MRILVCGSRNWRDYERIKAALFVFDISKPIVIDGAAAGADSLAHRAAKELGYPTERYPADWATHGKMAGFIRNQQMLTDGKPDLVMAFWDGMSRGTADMMRRARYAGVMLEVHT